MLHSPTYNQQTHKWALRELRRGIIDAKMRVYLDDHLQRALGNSRDKVVFQEFDLYTYAGSKFNPAFWVLPQMGENGFIHVQDAYEALVSPMLGVSKDPIYDAARVLKNCGHRSAHFEFLVFHGAPSFWAEPVGGVLALAQQFLPKGQVAQIDRKAGVINIDMDGFVMHVTPEGAYSNRLQKFIPARKRFRDRRMLPWPYVGYTYYSKLIYGLMTMVRDACDPALITALNGVVRGIKAMTYTEEFVRDYLIGTKAPAEITEKHLPDLHATNPELAMERAVALLRGDTGNPPNLIGALYDIVVPALYTKASFVRKFGDPDERRYRLPRAEVRAKWVQDIVIEYRLAMGLPV